MKLPVFLCMVIAAALLFSAPDALAKKKKKHKHTTELKDATIPAAGSKPDYSEPAEVLVPYVAHLDQLLALQRSGSASALAFYENAAGQIALARVEFLALRKSADAEDQAEFDGGIATCEVITKALDERLKVLGDIQSSQSVKGSGRLNGGPRKDSLTQGIKGGDIAKAVGATVELKREKAAAANAKNISAGTDDALTAMSLNRWNKRAAEIRKIITDAYAKTR